MLYVFLLSLVLQSFTDISPREFNSASMPAVKLILCMKMNSNFIYSFITEKGPSKYKVINLYLEESNFVQKYIFGISAMSGGWIASNKITETIFVPVTRQVSQFSGY